MRREFLLPEEDREHLDARGLPWETLNEGGERWVVLRGFPIPAGYAQPAADAAVRLVSGYPDAALDMVYFHPPVSLTSGKKINNLEGSVAIEGKPWQQWSRHRTNDNPWRPGIDNLVTHLSLVEHWLERELGKG